MLSPLQNVPWIDSPLFESELQQSDLDQATRALARDFARDGYLLIDLQIDDFDALADRIITACQAEPAYGHRIQDGWERIEPVRRLALAPRVLELLATLYRRQPIPMQTLNFGRGTEQRAHADTFHFHAHPPGFMCGVWVALEDIDEHNGPLEYYPGSQRLPCLDYTHLGLTASEQRGHEFYARYEELVQTLIARLGLERRVLCVPKGSAILWAANLLHGGQPVRDTTRTRHSQVTHYYFEGCTYYQPQRSDPFLGRIEHLHKRDIRTGRFIPHMYNGRQILARDTTLRDWLQRVPGARGLRRLLRRG